jgi:hypothetical protein
MRHICARSRLGVAQPVAPAEYPPLMTQASSALSSAGRVLSAVVRGEAVTVSVEEKDRRMAICHACVEWFDPVQNRCRKCACFLAVKPWLKAEQCPIGKW